MTDNMIGRYKRLETSFSVLTGRIANESNAPDERTRRVVRSDFTIETRRKSGVRTRSKAKLAAGGSAAMAREGGGAGGARPHADKSCYKTAGALCSAICAELVCFAEVLKYEIKSPQAPVLLRGSGERGEVVTRKTTVATG
ncbi:hypothetical protein EVAR_68443_1 [Eumeta japonica]|uniref:Uncharacterized protein n=1 Tax=Eumeta variegata TaxID=151549 RepID=A0A4C1ZU37_EUMVA|nr:hypothetical protein EVAR_68443_1 [Eumeta japonica]